MSDAEVELKAGHPPAGALFTIFFLQYNQFFVVLANVFTIRVSIDYVSCHM